jgi:hypothetical protein
MTAEELKAIRERVEAYEAARKTYAKDHGYYPEAALGEAENAIRRTAPADVAALLAEVERSRTELAALRRGIAVVLDRAAKGEDVVAALAALVR